jgi:mRNA interferase HigB
MHLVAEQALRQAARRHLSATGDITAWRAVAKDARWRSFDDVKQVFGDAEQVGDYVIFRIHRKRYRLVTIIHYPGQSKDKTREGHIWIRSFLNNEQFSDPANWEKGAL